MVFFCYWKKSSKKKLKKIGFKKKLLNFEDSNQFNEF